MDSAGDQELAHGMGLHQGRGEGHGRHVHHHLSVVHHLHRVILELDGVDLGSGTQTDQVPGDLRRGQTEFQTCERRTQSS